MFYAYPLVNASSLPKITRHAKHRRSFLAWWSRVPSSRVRWFLAIGSLIAVLEYAGIWYVISSTNPSLLP